MVAAGQADFDDGLPVGQKPPLDSMAAAAGVAQIPGPGQSHAPSGCADYFVTVVSCPLRPSSFLRTGRSAKTSFCEMEIEAAVGDLTLSVINEPGSLEKLNCTNDGQLIKQPNSSVSFQFDRSSATRHPRA